MIDLSKKKERENFQKEVNLLRQGIQEVTKQAASFVKVLEYLQEDADSMEKECEVWRMETKQNLMDLENEKRFSNVLYFFKQFSYFAESHFVDSHFAEFSSC